MPDLNLLPIFVTVAETWSMSAAARNLGIQKSSVSRGIAALEASLGVQLFHRSTRKLSLTTAGTAFYERARPVMASLRDLTGGLPEQEAEPSGELRLTVPIDMGLTFLPALVTEFARRYPQVQLDVRPTNRTVDLVGEGFDAGLRVASKLTHATLVARRLSPVELGIYASPTYLARRGTPHSLAEVSAHDWVGFRYSKPMPLEPPPKPRLFTDDLLFAHAAVREGMGLTVLPIYLPRQDTLEGRLVRVLPSWSFRLGSFYFVYPQTEHVPRKVAAFRDFLVAFIKANPLITDSV